MQSLIPGFERRTHSKWWTRKSRIQHNGLVPQHRHDRGPVLLQLFREDEKLRQGAMPVTHLDRLIPIVLAHRPRLAKGQSDFERGLLSLREVLRALPSMKHFLFSFRESREVFMSTTESDKVSQGFLGTFMGR